MVELRLALLESSSKWTSTRYLVQRFALFGCFSDKMREASVVSVDSQFDQLSKGQSKVLVEFILILGVKQDPFLELGVFHQCHLESSTTVLVEIVDIPLVLTGGLTSVGNIINRSPATMVSYWNGPSHFLGVHFLVDKSLKYWFENLHYHKGMAIRRKSNDLVKT
jgi:hypothetical protein